MSDLPEQSADALEEAAQQRLNEMAAKAKVGSSLPSRRMTPSEMVAARQAAIANRITWEAPPKTFTDLCARWGGVRDGERDWTNEGQKFILRIPRELLENPAGRVSFKGDDYLVIPVRSGGRTEDGTAAPVMVQYKAVVPWTFEFDSFEEWEISTSPTDELEGLEVMRCSIILSEDEFVSQKTQIAATAVLDQVQEKQKQKNAMAWEIIDNETKSDE